MNHIPVMAEKAIEMLSPHIAKNYIDATLGEGGHAKKILEAIGENGKLLAIDKSQESIRRAKVNLAKYFRQIIYVLGNFGDLEHIVKENNFKNIDGILYDLGMASWQIEESGVGISFSKNEPLDMRLSSDSRLVPASVIVNKFSAKQIADILYQYGDVRGSWAIARRIEQARRKQKIITTFDLINILKTKNPKFLAPVFQALRIYTNQELEKLQQSLACSVNYISKGGRIVVISFHSGEDRIVKNFFREQKKLGKLKILTKKPEVPTLEEIADNSRSRSAKMRAAEVL